jgi:hypothetical protein
VLRSATVLPASSMPVLPGPGEDLGEDERRLLRELVAAGPAAGVPVGAVVEAGLLGRSSAPMTYARRLGYRGILISVAGICPARSPWPRC